MKTNNTAYRTFFIFSFCMVLMLLIFSDAKAQTLEGTEDLALLEVHVTDGKGAPRIDDKIIFKGKTTQKTIEGKTAEDGILKILIPEGDIYEVFVGGWGDQDAYMEIDVAAQPGIVSAALQMSYDPPKEFTLDNVHFLSGQATLAKGSYAELNELVEFLLRDKTNTIEIAGHTDDRGSNEANLKLSQDRAETVVKYLIQEGVQAERLIAKGYGEEHPIADNLTDEGRQLNRRTEVRILAQ